MEPQKLINSINCSFRTFGRHSFRLIPSRHDGLCYIIEGTSSALNRFPNESEEVKVIEWFNDFWLFFSIKFKKIGTDEKRKVERKKESQINTHISLSIFQGDETDDKKCQLFRAEWDDYNNNSDEKHAQPHWHITSSQAIESTMEKYANVFEMHDFIEILEEEKRKVFDVKKIHFAMNGNWHNDGHHIHKVEQEQQIVKWLQGMLSHLRTELESL